MYNERGFISVLMPVYNGELHLREAIESVLAQTYTKFEFIIINDGSLDGTADIINSFNDSRIIKVANQSNLGLIESLNNGLKLAKGKYIARMDADDIAMPERFEEQLNMFENSPNAVVVGTDYFVMIGNKLNLSINEDDSDYLKTMLLFATCFCHPTVMVKNIFPEKKIAYDGDFIHAEDYKLWTDLVFHGDFRHINKPLLKYRSHKSQTSVFHNKKQLQISSRIRKEYLESLGFKITDEQFKTHNTIGNNEFIKSKEQLKKVEEWLSSLIEQNKEGKRFNEISFNKAIHKFWIDSCGYSNLGLLAYRTYFASEISNLVEVSIKEKLLLFGKCLIRKFKRQKSIT